MFGSIYKIEPANEAVAYIGKVNRVRLLPERQVGKLGDFTGYLSVGFQKAMLAKDKNRRSVAA
jgi:hypothetical protein